MVLIIHVVGGGTALAVDCGGEYQYLRHSGRVLIRVRRSIRDGTGLGDGGRVGADISGIGVAGFGALGGWPP